MAESSASLTRVRRRWSASSSSASPNNDGMVPRDDLQKDASPLFFLHQALKPAVGIALGVVLLFSFSHIPKLIQSCHSLTVSGGFIHGVDTWWGEWEGWGWWRVRGESEYEWRLIWEMYHEHYLCPSLSVSSCFMYNLSTWWEWGWWGWWWWRVGEEMPRGDSNDWWYENCTKKISTKCQARERQIKPIMLMEFRWTCNFMYEAQWVDLKQSYLSPSEW